MTHLRLLTVNALIRGDVRPRLRSLGTILDASDYDIVCLQEILHRGSAQLLRRLTRNYGYRYAIGFPLLAGGLMLQPRVPTLYLPINTSVLVSGCSARRVAIVVHPVSVARWPSPSVTTR